MWILESAPDSATIRNADEMAALHILVWGIASFEVMSQHVAKHLRIKANIGLPDVPEAKRSLAFESSAATGKIHCSLLLVGSMGHLALCKLG